ncbi:patatin-like phospholipase family protein [Amycolatopsis alkalitolerans]|uniref:Patatin-like phospholipase family protein n=1 Tax=Amycolatopsis alkalitolerans TaxID=2547244 RepID=A0A5C4LYU5_9PSEU|nr:patatin-like phospholipase family protein [Amycolatopsis alkalitolerans]TNC23515.1 patatin-like phospholipase family protein [Amycolatopsis alkalitolerans]
MTRRGVVLGGGGVAGIAWETGYLTGLIEAGRSVLDADLLVGTSAGSTVAAQITSGIGLPELYQRQVDPSLQAPELPAALDAEAMSELFGSAYVEATGPLDMRRRIGALALRAPTVPEAERRAVIAARLPRHSWPALDLRIVAVDAHTGEERVFDKDSGVDLVDAVAASCAVPATWPPVTIGARRYVDGGVRSLENADLAAGCERVLVFQVMEVPESHELDDQVSTLRASGARVTVIRPDEAAKAALGPNLLDPAVRGPAAKAGHEQGRREAAGLAWFWA